MPVPDAARRYGPSRFFFYNLFESDATGAPLAVRNRAAGTIDAYAAAVGRWLVTRDGFDLLVFYLSDYDYASHAQGPDAAHEALARSDDAVGGAVRGGRRAGRVPRALRRGPLLRPRADAGERGGAARRTPSRGALVTASNRAAMVYGSDADPRGARARGSTATPPSTSRSSARATRRSRGATARSSASRRPATGGDAALSTTRTGSSAPGRRSRTRTPASCSSPPRAGWEFADLGGRHHAGGGSHGSLAAGDSEVPMLDRRPRRAARLDHRREPAVARALRRRAAAVRARARREA